MPAYAAAQPPPADSAACAQAPPLISRLRAATCRSATAARDFHRHARLRIAAPACQKNNRIDCRTPSSRIARQTSLHAFNDEGLPARFAS